MLEVLSELSHWLVGFASSEWAIAVLAAVAFVESIFSPFPPDPILIAASLFNPEMAIVLAAAVTVASVAGALVGYWLGDRFGRPVLDRLVSARKVERVEVMFDKYGTWAIIFAAVSPVPYKVFAITAGAMDMRLKPFIIASLIGRGARMFLWAALILLFGETALELIETKGLLLGSIAGGGILAAFVLYLLYARIRRPQADASQYPTQPDTR
jgi:undecaprenyl-diphosphatase